MEFESSSAPRATARPARGPPRGRDAALPLTLLPSPPHARCWPSAPRVALAAAVAMAASAPRAAYSAVPARAAARRAVERGAYRLAWDAPQLASCANHPLSGLTLVGLARFIARHRGDVEPLRFARRLAFLTALAAFNTLLAVVEVLLYGVAVVRRAHARSLALARNGTRARA